MQLEARSYDLKLSGLTTEKEESLSRLSNPHEFAKLAKAEKAKVIEEIGVALDFCKQEDFAALMCV